MNFLRKIFKNEPEIEPNIEPNIGPIELGVFQTLPFECLLEIVSYLSLPECMFLRSSCHQLKTVVDHHFRNRIQKFPVLLSARYSAMKKWQFEAVISIVNDYENFTFGSTSGYAHQKLVEKKQMFFTMNRKNHFWLKNYLVLFDVAKFNSFVSFITNYLPKITKLALVIDHDDYLKRIPEVLNIYQGQLKVLLLEKTRRSSLTDKTIRLPAELYQSIESLEALEELYFFAKPTNRFPDYQTNQVKQRFQRKVFSRLRVLHMSEIFDLFFAEGPDGSFNLGPNSISYVSYLRMEELACHSIYSQGYGDFSGIVPFPCLQKCILLGPEDGADLNSFHRLLMYQLKEVRFNSPLVLTPKSTDRLFQLRKLERIHCVGVDWRKSSLSRIILNLPIKVIEIDELQPPNRQYSDEVQLMKVLSYLIVHFTNLEKVIIQKPFMVLTGSRLPSRQRCTKYLKIADF